MLKPLGDRRRTMRAPVPWAADVLTTSLRPRRGDDDPGRHSTSPAYAWRGLLRLHSCRFMAPESLATAANARLIIAVGAPRSPGLIGSVRSYRFFSEGTCQQRGLACVPPGASGSNCWSEFRRWRCGWIWRTSRLRNRTRSVAQGQQRYRSD